MTTFKRFLNGISVALRGNPSPKDLYVAARELGIMRLNVKHYGYHLARQLEGKLKGVDCSHEPQKYNLISKPTTQDDMESPWFAYWCKQLKIAPIYHRKIWEYAFVLQSLHDHGLLHDGVRAMGFGCGEEPMASYFASMGLDVLVTDLDPAQVAGKGWAETQQHAKTREFAFRSDLVSRQVFDAKVAHAFVDMNDIKQVDKPFDICWSICAMEHLGSIEAGLSFVENSLKVLKPGGVAIHTTEYNYLSDDQTRDQGETVLFLRKHFQALADRLRTSGHELLGPDFSVGQGVLDDFIDIPPYDYESDGWLINDKTPHMKSQFPAHLKLSVAGYASTCFGLIVRKSKG
jgi:2-polyprenyl-3-methyl-5-hydroxy-6-metoxy-1,4-benzoquinol methylase